MSNGIPELVNDVGLGGTIELRDIDNADRGLSPLEIWCCEAQERYVLAISPDSLDTFKSMAARERCGFRVVGRTTGQKGNAENKLILTDRDSKENEQPINLPMETLFGKPPKLSRTVKSRHPLLPPFDSSLATYLPKATIDGVLDEAIQRVLQLPAVGSKSFLITIGDRSVSGLVVRISFSVLYPIELLFSNSHIVKAMLTPRIVRLETRWWDNFKFLWQTLA